MGQRLTKGDVAKIEAQIVDFLEIGTRLGRGCNLAFGTFHIDIHYVASVAGKGAAYASPGFLIDGLVRQAPHRRADRHH